MMENKVKSRLSTTPSSSSTSSPSSSRLLSPATKIDTSPIDFDNEKDLYKQIEDIHNEFKQKDSRDWSFRYKSLIQLQRIVNGNGIEMKQFTTYIRAISPSLIEQVTEVRSTIVKEACAVVESLALRLKSRFEPFSLLYLQALLKVVVVKVAITAEAAHTAILAILNNVQTKGLLASIITASQDQHNEQLRRRSADYILVILTRAIEEPGMILLTSVPQLERAISTLLVDGGSDIRSLARLAFWAYCELNEKSAMTMLYEYTPTTQKNLFSMLDQLPPAQFELASRIHQMQLEEAENLAIVTESMDIDLDMNDFKKTDKPSTTPVNGARSKTPTSSGRASGLKNRVPTTSTSTSSTTSSTTSSSSTSGIPRRSGSSLGMNPSLSSSGGPVTAAKKMDASSIIRSKSSLGTTRIPTSSHTTSLSSTTKTTLSSTSPNTSTQTGRASSIGSRLPTSAPQSTKPTLSQTLKANQIKSAAVQSLTNQINKPPATLTKSTSKTSLSQATTSTTTTSSSSTTTSPPSRLSKSVSSSSLPSRKSITPTSSTSTTTTSNKSPPLTRSTTPTLTKSPVKLTTPTNNNTKASSTTETLSTKKKFITSSSIDEEEADSTIDNTESLLDEKWLNRDVTKINDVEDLIEYSNTLVESLANIELEIDSLHESGLQFNQISDALANNIRDAKKEIDELSIDDLDTPSHVNNSNNSSNNSGTNRNISSSSNSSSSIKKEVGEVEDDEFNWVEDSVDQALIEDDVIDFDQYSSFKKNNQTFNNNKNSNSNSFKSFLETSSISNSTKNNKDNKRNTLNPDDLLLLEDDLNQDDYDN